ncbi:ATP-dependent Clp protease proteolytic subunit, partial [Streptomyces sp. NPDC004561]
MAAARVLVGLPEGLLGLGDQVYNRLLNERIIFLGQQVDDDIANK